MPILLTSFVFVVILYGSELSSRLKTSVSREDESYIVTVQVLSPHAVSSFMQSMFELVRTESVHSRILSPEYKL